MSIKHTLGPWRCHGDGWITTGDGVARIAFVAGEDEDVEVSDDQRDADARLIAAAPELLAACEMCERIITEIKEVPGGWDSGANRQNLIAARHYIREALAKAVQS